MEGSYWNAECFTFDIEKARRDILYEWRQKRLSRRTGLHGTMYKNTKLFINRSLVQSFMYNLSIVVAFQMLLGAICTYLCVKLGLEMDTQMSLFVSPIVFPLAFSINANYQRRESVLEDLAMFKSSSSILFFCHRDWIKAAALPVDLLQPLSNKLRFIVINIREYLLTEDSEKRKFILQAIYEDLSDVAQLNDKMRTSPVESNSALVARIIHLHNLMCLAFERLRVIREYNSPRSLRAFTKVFIFLMPLLLSPYYVFSGRQTESEWTPYYISVIVSFLYGSLQAVQDKLDDPFDGIGEDDVKLEQLNDWTTQLFLDNLTVNVRIGRFTVATTIIAQKEHRRNNIPVPPFLQHSSNEESSPKRTRHISLSDVGSPKGLRRILSRKSERNPEGRKSAVDQLEPHCYGISPKLEGISEKLLYMKSDAVVRLGESSQKRPTVLGLFASPEGNALTEVSDNVFASPDEMSSPPTHDVFSPNSVDEVSFPIRTRISSRTSGEISPSTNSSEDLPLLPVNSSVTNEIKHESGSISEGHHPNELTPTSSRDGTSEGIKGGTSESDGVPKLRFCLPGKHGARGDGVRLWGGRKHKKKRPPSKGGKGKLDLEPTATNSTTLLLPHGSSHCGEIEEKSEFVEPSGSADLFPKDSDIAMDVGLTDNGCANDGIVEPGSIGKNNGNAETGYTDRGRTDIGFTDQTRNTSGLETGSINTKPVATITEEARPQIVVHSPVEEESSLWDFDLSSNEPSGSNTLPDDEVTDTTRLQNIDSSSPSIVSSNVSPEPGGSRFSVSRNSADSENSRKPKPNSLLISKISQDLVVRDCLRN